MGSLVSFSPAALVEELRDRQAFPVVFFTGLGRNGSRQYRLADQARQPIDLGGKSLRLVVKTGPDQPDTELDANFPLSGTIDNAAAGLFTMDFAAVDFAVPQPSVLAVLYDAGGANPVVLAQVRTVIRKAGV